MQVTSNAAKYDSEIMALKPEQLLVLAEVAGFSYRFEDWIQFLQQAMQHKGEDKISSRELSILSAGFFSLATTTQRKALQIINMTLEKYHGKSAAVEALQLYKSKIQNEVYDQYQLVSNMIQTKCLTQVQKDEKKALFHFMIGNIAHDTTKIVGEKLTADVK